MDQEKEPLIPLYERVKHHSLSNQVRLLWNCIEELQKKNVPFKSESEPQEEPEK